MDDRIYQSAHIRGPRCISLVLKMLKSINLLAFTFLFSFLVCQAQDDTKGAIVTMQFDGIQPNGQIFSKADTFLVRSDFILEPIKVNYSTSETDFGTGITRETSAGKRLQWYNITNYREMIGMSFDIEKKYLLKQSKHIRFLMDVNLEHAL